MVEKLLTASARNATRDCFGVSPAHYAAQGGHREVVDRLFTSAGGAVCHCKTFVLLLGSTTHIQQ